MALKPDCIFRNRVSVDSNQGKLISGADWYDEYTSAQPGDNDLYIKVNDVLQIDPGDLSSLSTATHTSAANGLKFDLFSLGSGVDFSVSVYTGVDIGSRETVYISGCFKYNGQYFYNINGLWEAGGFAQGHDAVLWCPVSLAKTYGIKFIVKTNYTYGLAQAVEGVTKAAYFDVMALIPGTNTAYMSGFQSWNHINPDSLYFLSLKDDPDASDWIYNPQYWWAGYLDNTATTYMPVLRTDDLETLYDDIKTTINPGFINPFGVTDPEEPTQEGDPSGTGGGGGNMDPSSDPIAFPGLPVGGALLSGAIKAYEVDATILTQIFQKLWNTSIFDIATFQKLVEAPLDSLISLQCVPIDPHTTGTGHVMLGNFDTEAVANKIDQEYYTIDCGTLKVEEYWGSALDYSPYTSAEIWVPMIGFRDLDINDIMGKTIHLKYNYSIFDGNLTAQLMCGNSVLYKWSGNVREIIPVTARVNDALQRLVTGAMGVASAATGAGMAAAAIGAAVNVAMSKTHVSRTGEMGGSAGLLDDFVPFLIIHRPIQSLAAGFKTQKGYPSNITAVLNTLSGYTEVEYIHLQGLDMATDTELQEIEQLLKSGVII